MSVLRVMTLPDKVSTILLPPCVESKLNCKLDKGEAGVSDPKRSLGDSSSFIFTRGWKGCIYDYLSIWRCRGYVEYTGRCGSAYTYTCLFSFTRPFELVYTL